MPTKKINNGEFQGDQTADSIFESFNIVNQNNTLVDNLEIEIENVRNEIPTATLPDANVTAGVNEGDLVNAPSGDGVFKEIKAITVTKTQTGKNIFNKNNVVPNKYMSVATPETLITRTGSLVTGFIEIDESKKGQGIYIQGRDFNIKTLVAFDENKSALPPIYGSGNHNTGPVNGFYALPKETKFIRANLQIGSDNVLNLDNVQIAFEIQPSAVEPFNEVEFLDTVNDFKIKDNFETVKKTGVNLFNPVTYLLGTSILNVGQPTSDTDVLTKDADSACSRLIPCEGLTDYTVQGRLSNIKGFAFYNSSKEVLAPVQGGSYWDGPANGVYTSPVNARFMRFQTTFSGLGDPELVQVEKGSVPSQFEHYNESIELVKYKGVTIEKEAGVTVLNNLEYRYQAVKLDNDVLTIVSKYDNQYNTVTVFKRHLRNNLFLISSVYLVASTGVVTNNDFNKQSEVTLIDATLTDIISPYKLNDGFDDHPSPFISGNHGHGATPTASLLEYSVYVDGVKLNNGGSFDAKEVQINTVSEVYLYSGQAQDPVLESVVFNELHNYTVVDGTISVNVGLEIKQDIEFITMYGIQGTPFLSDIDSVYVSNSIDQEITPYVTETRRFFGNINTYDKADRAIFLNTTTNNCIEHFIDKSFGLAKNPNISDFPWVFFETSSSGKVYFNLINLPRGGGLNFSNGDYISYRGGFHPFRNVAENQDEIAYVKEEKGYKVLTIDIARSTTDTRNSIYKIVGFADRDLEVIEKTDTITVNDLRIDARGVFVTSTGYGNIKLRIL